MGLKIFTLTNDNHMLNDMPDCCRQVFAGELDIKRWGYLSALYEVVKLGVDDNIVGVTLDGRMFDMQIGAKEGTMESAIEEMISKVDIITEPINKFIIEVSRPERVSAQFARCHTPSCLFYAYEAICHMYPHYEEAFYQIMDRYTLHLHNTFITKDYIFKDYVKWLFDIIFYVDKALKTTSQNYILSSLPERLMDIYIQHNGLTIKEVPCIRIE